MKKKFYMDLVKVVGVKNIKCDEEMKNHSSLRVGGKVNFLVDIKSESELIDVVKLLIQYNQNYYIIGRGSNILVKDEGFDGVIVKLSNKFSGIDRDGKKLTVLAGTPLAEVSKFAYKNSLSGIEFASGIPGSVGGAIAMNAGAYGGEMKDIVKSVKLLDEYGNIKILESKDMMFSYRRSLLTDNPRYIVVSVEIELKDGKKDEILNEMMSRAIKRAGAQPLNKCNCGSTFKRPEGHFAGQLIEECGLKGYKYNGVEVSSKHAGFIVNNGKSNSSDMLAVIDFVKKNVKDKFGIELEEEVRII